MADSYVGLGTNTTKWLRKPDFAQNLSTRFVGTKGVLQFLGSMGLWTENAVVPKRMKLTYYNDTKEEEKEMLDFFSARKGQWGAFWVPSWITQFKLMSMMSLGSNQLTVRNDLFHQSFMGYERIMFWLTSGDVVVRQVSACSLIDSATELITLKTGVDRNILTTDVILLCQFVLARFDTDLLAVQYNTDGVSQVDFELREVVREYPA